MSSTDSRSDSRLTCGDSDYRGGILSLAGTNLYAYVADSPGSLTDAFGDSSGVSGPPGGGGGGGGMGGGAGAGGGTCAIQVKCRRVRGSKFHHKVFLALARPVHCYIVVTDGGGGNWTVTGGPDPKDGSRSRVWPIQWTGPKDPEPNNKRKDKTYYCDKNAPCETAQCIIDKENEYDGASNGYDYRGKKAPNSNSAVKWITGQCGISPTPPNKAPGWNFY
jgi:hypothetical protein